MRHGFLGTSSVAASALILGGNVFGHFCDAKETQEIVDAAFALGVTTIDTADVYSNGDSERFIGAAMRRQRSAFQLATKIGLRTGEKPDGAFRADKIVQAVDASLLRLRTDYIDLYQLHAFDPATPLAEPLGALNELIHSGKILAYGLSNYSLAQLKAACAVAEHHSWSLPASVQLWWNVLDREHGASLQQHCLEKKIALLPYGVLARGLLSGKYAVTGSVPEDSRARESRMLRADMTSERLQKAERLDVYARSLGYTGAQLALAWMLGQRGVASCIVGVRNVTQLKEMAAAATWRLTEEQCAEAERIVAEPDA